MQTQHSVSNNINHAHFKHTGQMFEVQLSESWMMTSSTNMKRNTLELIKDSTWKSRMMVKHQCGMVVEEWQEGMSFRHD